MNKKKCFVITPIGKDGSKLRKDMDEVIKYGISEAMDNYEVIAAHNICEPGSITEQIVEKIAESDILIANLTECNPNVMYELALSHCTGKPVIMIAREGTKLPFDIGNQRTIWYGQRAEELKKLSEKLRETVTTIESKKKRYEFPEILKMLEQVYGISLEKAKAVIDPLFLKVGNIHEPPILIMPRGELEANLSLEERTGGAQKIRIVNYAGTSFLANNEISTSYPSEWKKWFEKALKGGTIFNFVLTKPDSSAAKDAEKYKMYPEGGADIDKSTLIRKNQERIQELVEKYPGLKLSARFTEVALPYALFETTFSDSTKNHIKVDLYSPLTQHDLVRPSFMVYRSKNPLLYRHFTTVINHLEDPNNSEKVDTMLPSKKGI